MTSLSCSHIQKFLTVLGTTKFQDPAETYRALFSDRGMGLSRNSPTKTANIRAPELCLRKDEYRQLIGPIFAVSPKPMIPCVTNAGPFWACNLSLGSAEPVCLDPPGRTADLNRQLLSTTTLKPSFLVIYIQRHPCCVYANGTHSRAV